MSLNWPCEKVWPTWARACHNVVIWAAGTESIVSFRLSIDSGQPAAVIIFHRFDASLSLEILP